MPKRDNRKSQIIENIITFVSSNTYALLIGGVVALIISTILMTIACKYRCSSKRDYKKLSSNGSSVGFHRIKNFDDDEDDDANNSRSGIMSANNGATRNNIDDDDNVKLTLNSLKSGFQNVGSKIKNASSRYIMSTNDADSDKVNFKLLNQSSDNENGDDDEEEEFSR